MTEPREFSCFDDCGNGWGDTKWDLEEKYTDRIERGLNPSKIKPQPQKHGKVALFPKKQHNPHEGKK